MTQCICGSQKTFDDCCKPYLTEECNPNTPEQLMRSRYSAYATNNFDYVEKTMRGKPLKAFNQQEMENSAQKIVWQKLTIINAPKIKSEAQVGFVEFIAQYQIESRRYFLHEISEFHQIDGRWFYVDGEIVKTQRNDPCPCGSGRKYKKCCGKG